MFSSVSGLTAYVVTAVLIWLGVSVLLAMMFRTVVPTNEVHIIQSRRRTVSYGKDQPKGNTYYSWPAWVPVFGIRIIKLPVSVFDAKLDNYAAYDKGRVPFVIDIMAFFRIEDSNVAAQRVSSFKELTIQLNGILQGASRSILAQSPIEEILEERAKYGQMFTDATNDQLKSWGVVNVKNIELMDIRDAQGSQVIQRIMAKKQSLIEMESRVEVAKNIQSAQTAEIDANRAVQVRKQEADEQVGVRTAQRDQQVGIAGQQAQQKIKEEARATAEKEMAVLNVQHVRQAEIDKQVQIVGAEQQKATLVLVAEGDLASANLHAQATRVEGDAKGAAETAVLMAPVTTQINLAKEIGSNSGYQQYLVTVKQIEANRDVGLEQAKALEAANIKVIANAGGPVDGVKTVMDLFTPKGGTQVGAALEALKNTDVGAALVNAVTRSNGSGPQTGE